MVSWVASMTLLFLKCHTVAIEQSGKSIIIGNNVYKDKEEKEMNGEHKEI